MSPNEKPVKPNNITPRKNKNLKLGELFERRRKELRMSLESVERTTHIRVKYLELIESGDYANLEDNVYSKGYVKNYADLLGFDTKAILRIYSQERHDYELAQNIKPGKKKAVPKTYRSPDLHAYPQDFPNNLS